jgi:hypothetical protein
MKRKATLTEPKPDKTETMKFDQPKEVRAIARERVGAVKPSRPIQPKDTKKKPKHKKPITPETEA